MHQYKTPKLFLRPPRPKTKMTAMMITIIHPHLTHHHHLVSFSVESSAKVSINKDDIKQSRQSRRCIRIRPRRHLPLAKYLLWCDDMSRCCCCQRSSPSIILTKCHPTRHFTEIAAILGIGHLPFAIDASFSSR